MRPKHNPRTWFPPKVPLTPMALIKRATAWVFRARLVWLRNIDNSPYLAVAYDCKSDEGEPELIAYRFWPNLRKVVLNDDGTVTTHGEKSYVVHWIAADVGEQTLMLFKNYDVYDDFWAGYD